MLGLKALTAADEGRSINFGESMSGKVRVGRDGVVSVHVSWRYRFGGKTRELRIGTWREKDGMSLKGLRDERDRLATLVRSGIDPIEHKALERLKLEAEHAETERRLREQAEAERLAELDRQRRLTVRQLFERWCQTQLQPRLRTDGKRVGRVDGGEFVRAQFERHVFPRIGDMAAADLRKADLLALLDVQTAAGKLRTANMLLADLKQMFDFALDRDLIAGNPLATIKKSKVGGVNVERERVLSDEELRQLDTRLHSARMNPRSVAAVWLTLGTAVRVGELMGAVWADSLPATEPARTAQLQALAARGKKAEVKIGLVDLEKRTWYLPDTKNQRNHRIHLSDFALAQLTQLRALREELKGPEDGSLSPWVFPATDNRSPVCVKSFGKQLADRQRSPEERLSGRSKATTALMMPGGKWTAHDLRRTAATLMARLGFSSDVINECLNHVQSDRMAKVYIRDRREVDQARAFDALGGWLLALQRGEAAPAVPNVVPLRVA